MSGWDARRQPPARRRGRSPPRSTRWSGARSPPSGSPASPTTSPRSPSPGADGAPMTLADFKGKVALVNLWATWCAPCRKEMPALDRLAGALGGDDFSVVPVSIDTGERQRPAAFLEQIGVKNLPLYTDRSTEIFESPQEEGTGDRAAGDRASRPQRLPARPHQRPGRMGQRGRQAADRSGGQERSRSQELTRNHAHLCDLSRRSRRRRL